VRAGEQADRELGPAAAKADRVSWSGRPAPAGGSARRRRSAL